MFRLCSLSVFLVVLLIPLTVSQAQDAAFQIQGFDEAAPKELSSPILEQLSPLGYKILSENGKPLAEIWLRKQIATKKKPSGPEGAVQFPFLEEGELLGVVRFLQEAHDHREQSILPGLYTVRFGLHPINGDHLGVSPYRDYGLLLPAEKDSKLAAPDRKALESASAEASGTNHPAVLLLQSVKNGSKAGTLTRNEEKNFWGLVVPLMLNAEGEADSVAYPLEFVFFGAAAI